MVLKIETLSFLTNTLLALVVLFILVHDKNSDRINRIDKIIMTSITINTLFTIG